jgi:segregation and condensation protein B
VGTEPESGAVLYGTTGFFLERLGVSSVADLPAVSEFLPDPYALDADDVSTST